MQQGWIKLHRELIDKPIWRESTPEQKTVLMTILLMANHKENQWEFKGEKYNVKPGQFITSLKSIAEKSGAGVSIQNVRSSLKRFEKYDFLTSEPTNKNRLITVVNWANYQVLDEDPTSNPTSSQQAANKQPTTNKNVKKEKNEKKLKTISHKFSISDMDNAKLLLYLMQENNPEVKTPNLDKWADDMRLIRERDKREDKHIKWLIRWAQDNDFWSSNILSPIKLRKQWDQLVLKAKNEHQRNQQLQQEGQGVDQSRLEELLGDD